MLELRLRRMIEDASTDEAALRRLFSRFDKDNSGKLSRQEMKRVFSELGVKSSDAEIQELVFGLDRSNDGLCSYEEFVRIAYPTSNNMNNRSSTGRNSQPTSSLVTLLSERLKDMIRKASGSERELRALFSKFDTKNTGRLTRAKFQTAFGNMGLSAPAKEVQELIDAMDTTGDGMISYGEFVNIVHGGGGLNGSGGGSRNTNISNRVHAVLQRLVDDASWTRSSIRRLFLSFDKSNDGYITRSEFRRAFRDLKVQANDSEIDELIRAIDTNRDGRISYSEFLDMAYTNNRSSSSNSSSGRYGDDRNGGDRNGRDRNGDSRGSSRYNDDARRGNDRSRTNNSRSSFFGSSNLDLVDKFKQAMRRANWTRSTLSELFNKFDQNRNGTISHREFSNVVKKELNLGETHISSRDIDQLLNAMDQDGDGQIDYKEFSNVVLGKVDAGSSGSSGSFGSSGSAMGSRNGGASSMNAEACLQYVDQDLKRQLKTDMPWGLEKDLMYLFEKYDYNQRNEINKKDLIKVIDEMNVRVDTNRFVNGLIKGLNNGKDNRDSRDSRDGDRPVPYRDFVALMCRGSSIPASGANGSTMTSMNMNLNLNGTGMSTTGMGGGLRALTKEQLFQEDIAAATAAARTVHAAADQMAMLRNENFKLKKELSSFNVQFFEEIEDLKFAYLTQTRRCDALTRHIYSRCENPDEIMKQIELEAGLEIDLQRNGSQGRRQRWNDLNQRTTNNMNNGMGRSMGGSMGGSRGAMQSFPRRGPVPLANEWEVSDQWLQLVFDMADGSALAELERSCRMFDTTNTGTIAAPELRMALRNTLSTQQQTQSGGNMVLAPSAMVFGELVRRFESSQSRRGGVPGVDYSNLLKSILNRGQRPEFADYLAPNNNGSYGSNGGSNGGRGEDDAVMAMIREWCNNQPGNDIRRILDDIFSKIDNNNSGKISKKEFDEVLLDMRLEASNDQLNAVMRMYDIDGDGIISYQEFVTAVLDGPRGGGRNGRDSGRGRNSGSRWSDVLDNELKRRIEDAKWTGESLRKLFLKFDRNDSGKISTREFKNAFADMGIPSKYVDVEELVRKMDQDGDGYINYQEFVNAALPGRGSGRGSSSSRYDDRDRNDRNDRDRSGRNSARGRNDRDRGRGDRSPRGRGYDDRDRSGRNSARGSDRGRDRDRNRDDRDRDGRNSARGRSDRDRDRDRDRGSDRSGRNSARGSDRGRDRDRDRGSDRGRDRGRDRDDRDSRDRNGSSRRGGSGIADMLDDKLCDLIRKASWNKESLRKLFEKFDKDRSGKISSTEFKRAFEGLGLSTSQYDVNDLVRRIDADGDGFVNFNEFVDAALRPSSSTSKSGGYKHYAAAIDEKLRKLVRDAKFSEGATKKLFAKFDMNHSGCITVGEFKRGFMEMGISTSTKEITNLIDRLDR